MSFWKINDRRKSAPPTPAAGPVPPNAGHPSTFTEQPAAPPLMDVHLLMNGFNQMAAHLYATTGKDDPRLFAIADYLQHGLRNGNATIRYAEEAQLLHSYVELLSLVKGGAGITLEVQPPTSPDSHEIPRHLSCELLALLLKALPTALTKEPLHVWLRPYPAPHATALVIECVGDDRQRTAQNLEAELRPCAGRWQAHGWQITGTTGAGQADGLAWTVLIQKKATP